MSDTQRGYISELLPLTERNVAAPSKVGAYGEAWGGHALNPTEIASKEFPVVMRGYLREEVQAFLAGISDQIAARDNRITQLDAEVARLKTEKPAPAPAPAAPAPEPIAALDRP